MSDIALRYLRDAERWRDIYRKNWRTISEDPRNRTCVRLFGREPPDWIFPGQVLVLPLW